MKKISLCFVCLVSLVLLFSCTDSYEDRICMSNEIMIVNKCDMEIFVNYEEFDGNDLITEVIDIGCDVSEKTVTIPVDASNEIEVFTGSCIVNYDVENDINTSTCDRFQENASITVEYDNKIRNFDVSRISKMEIYPSDFDQ